MSAPAHYKDYALWEVLERDKVPFVEGCVIKYVYRWRAKDGIKDLLKAKDNLDRLIEKELERLDANK